MKPPENDEWLDQIISRATATDQPVPDFKKWLKSHPRLLKR